MKRLIFMCLFLLTMPLMASTILKGAGATFPFPLYQKWIQLFQKQSDIRITYQGVGSSSGIRQLKSKDVDFGATDAFLNDDDLKQSERGILHIPTCVGAVVVIYNLPEQQNLKFTPEVLSNIFLGKITTWSDPQIVKINPQIHLPETEISIIHRSEGSGTTFIFTDYLSKVNLDWDKKIGKGKTVVWPKGMGVEGNPGVAELVKKIPGSIGYVELTYASTHQLPVAAIKNKAGHFILPSLESVSQAAEVTIPNDTRVLLTNTDAQNGYPISSFTYLIFFQEQFYQQRTREKAEALVAFLNWAIHEGQAYNKSMLYSPLPQAAVAKAEKIIGSITYQGLPVKH